jgi:uncharacterized membrane protein YfcA
MIHWDMAGALAIALAGGVLQGMVGFGFGLFSVPLLLAVGFSAPTVLAVAAICTAVQAGSGVHHLRHAVPWKQVGVSFLVRGAAMFLGTWALRWLVDYPVSRIKFCAGAVVLLLVLVQTVWQPTPRAELRGGWTLTAFLASGFAGGLCSMGGPPLVMWTMAHDWSTERTRAFLFAAFMTTVPLQLLLLYWLFGSAVLRGMALGIVLSPAVLAGSLAGLRMGGRFSRAGLRRLAYAVLVLIAVSSMTPQMAEWSKETRTKGANPGPVLVDRPRGAPPAP